MSSTTQQIVFELRRLKGDWIFKSFCVTIAWSREEEKWWISMRHKRRGAWDTQFLVEDELPTDIAQEILKKAEEATSGKR